jgi:hypothetical protein
VFAVSAPAFTPGPWRFELNEKSKSVQLCGGNPKSGFGRYDLTVMDFVRWGMSGAAPRFAGPSDHRLLTRVEAFGQIVPGREHHAAWFKRVDNPDARLIEAAPDLYDALSALLGPDRELGGRDTPRIRAAHAALAKARGEVAP